MVAHSKFGDGEDDEWLQRRALKRAKRQEMAAAIHRRRCQATVLLATDGGQGPSGKKRRSSRPFVWEEHVTRFSEAEFKLRYRFTFDAFTELVELLRADLSVSDEKQAKHAKWGTVIQPETKLAMALRFLAGGSPLDLKLIYDVSKSYVYHCVWLVVAAVNKKLPMDFPIDDVGKLRKLEAEWRARARCSEWYGQVGALDGVHFPMLAPSKKDVDDPMRYFVARKDKYALLAMAICDSATLCDSV
jgi:hypothetical protein